MFARWELPKYTDLNHYLKFSKDMRVKNSFVRLPHRFDVNQLVKELNSFDEQCWMEHPSKMEGNSALPLVSYIGERNHKFEGQMRPTDYLATTSYMKQVMASFGEVLSRSRLMRLASGAEVSEHVDFNYHWHSRVRIHVPIKTNPDVTFHCGEARIHMAAGEAWLFDSWRRHRVINAGREDRVHLVIDLAGSSRFWNLVRKIEQINTSEDDFARTTDEMEISYLEDKQCELRTEKFNVAPVMAPGELEALITDLIENFTSQPLNDKHLVEEYKAVLYDLANDWREAWHLYGYEQEGWPRYKELLNRTASRLRKNPRALITSGNEIGINPIIMQRILNAALNIDQLPEFTKNHN